jgi:serine protease Do
MRLVRAGLVPLALVTGGIIIGVVVASNMGWLPTGTAGPEPVPYQLPPPMARPVATAPQLPMAGGNGKNFVEIVKSVKPAVVNIAASRSGKAGEGPHGSPFDDPFFRKFFGDELFKRDNPQREPKERGQGSGVIVESKGLIVTNNHVVNKADEIRVFLSDKREFKGKLIGTDAKTDIAIVKIEATGLPTVPWADSDQLEVGEYVLAVGSPFGLTQTVTMGIVSAVGRASMGIAEYEDFIQTDAAINPGNSGGALVNVRGELVGINTAIFSQSGGNMGIGFAVPSNLSRAVMEQLVRTGKVVRGWLGVAIQDLTPELASQFGITETKGVLVSDVMDESPAKKAGVERADVIVDYDGKPMDSPTHLRNAVAQTPIGKKVSVKVIREKKPKTIEVTIVEQPKSVGPAGTEENRESAAPTGMLSDLEVRELTDELASRYGVKAGERGVIVVGVKAGSTAEEMGVREGDMILEVNRKAVTSLKSYERAAAGLPKDQAVLLLLKRKGQAIYLTLRP